MPTITGTAANGATYVTAPPARAETQAEIRMRAERNARTVAARHDDTPLFLLAAAEGHVAPGSLRDRDWDSEVRAAREQLRLFRIGSTRPEPTREEAEEFLLLANANNRELRRELQEARRRISTLDSVSRARGQELVEATQTITRMEQQQQGPSDIQELREAALAFRDSAGGPRTKQRQFTIFCEILDRLGPAT